MPIILYVSPLVASQDTLVQPGVESSTAPVIPEPPATVEPAGESVAVVVPPAPASSSTGSQDASVWRSRRGLAFALQSAIVIAPGIVAFGVSLLLGDVLPRPTNIVFGVVRLFAILAISAGTMVAARVALQRLAPLAFLLRLSLAFPNETPKRLRTALRAPSARALEQRLSDIDERGLTAEPKEVAAEIVSMVASLSGHHRLTRGHSERVRAYAELIGTEIGLDEQELQKLRWAALLHDLGKITVPTEILDLKGRPDPEEWAILAGHPAASARLADSLKDWLGPWWYGIGQHHEKWDGSGYPDKLAGTNIALAGRIVALADAFETMTAVRSYKRAMSMPVAQAEVVRCAGTHFDPDVVRAFLNIGLRRLRRVAGFTAWLPLQAIGLLRQLGNLAAPVAQAPAALALATTVAVNTFVPALHASVVAPQPQRAVVVASAEPRLAASGTGVSEVLGTAIDVPAAEPRPAVPAVPADSPTTSSTRPSATTVAAAPEAKPRTPTSATTNPPASGSRPGPAAVTPSSAAKAPVPAATGPTDQATNDTSTAHTSIADTSTAETDPATSEPTATDPATSEPTATTGTTSPATTAPATTAPATTTPPTTTTATSPPTTAPATTAPATTAPATTAPATTSPATTAPATTAPPLSAPTFVGAQSVNIVGDGRQLSVKPNVNGHGFATSCTVSLVGIGLSANGSCSATQQLNAALWNTTYTVRIVASSTAGAVQTDVTVTTGLKILTIDAFRHWPCPGLFCGSSAAGFASPFIFAAYTSHAAGTTLSLVCWTIGSTVDTRSPFSSGNEVTNIWVKSNEASNPYYSVLSFPTPGPTARDGLPAC